MYVLATSTNALFRQHPRRRCLQSPGSCQGAAALDEVCPPAAAAASAAEPSRFELVAGEEGVAAGQEVTISYGSWPSDVFLLFFGFAPHDNPHDSGGMLGAPQPDASTVVVGA